MNFVKNIRLFFRGFFFNPRTTGAILPSSKYLARKMASYIDTAKSGFILELGPGTGVVTQSIIDLHVPENKIIALELSTQFAGQLRERFPAITLIEGNATHLSELMKNKKPIHTIISSLPLRSLSKEMREIIFFEITKTIEKNGRFIQFTYSMKNDNDFYPKNFKLIHSSIVIRNIPPAKVTVFSVSDQ